MEPSKPNLDERLSRLYAAPVPESFETGWRADIRREESIQRMNKRNWKPLWRRVAPALCALVLVVGGLWAGALEDNAYENGAASTSMVSRAVSGGVNAKMSANYSMMATTEEIAYDSAASADGGMGMTTYGAAQETGRKLVRTASLTIRTKAFDDALAQVQARLAETGGYVEDMYQYGESVRTINLTLRVPSEKLDEFLQSLEGAGKVTDRSESTTDMTTQYVDNQARLKTLYEKRDRLNAMIAKAETVEDLIEIESAIADTQYQIDSYETSQKSIDRQVDMSSVSLTLREQEQTVVNPELTLMERIRAGFADSIEWLGEFLRDMVVFVVMISPVLGVVLAVWLIWKGIRKIRKGRTE